MNEDMEGYRCGSMWKDTDVCGHGRIQICEFMEAYRCVSRCMRTWEDQMWEDMGGYRCMNEYMGGFRCMSAWESTDV